MDSNELSRIVKVETQLSGCRKDIDVIGRDVKKIMVNDLPHIRLLINEKITKLTQNIDKRLDKLDRKVTINWIKISGITTAGVVVLNYLAGKYL